MSLPAARRTTCSPTWREQALKVLCSQPPQQLRVRGLRETASHINVHHGERILRGLEPTQPAGRAARRRRKCRCPFRKDKWLFKRTQGFSRSVGVTCLDPPALWWDRLTWRLLSLGKRCSMAMTNVDTNFTSRVFLVKVLFQDDILAFLGKGAASEDWRGWFHRFGPRCLHCDGHQIPRPECPDRCRAAIWLA